MKSISIPFSSPVSSHSPDCSPEAPESPCRSDGLCPSPTPPRSWPGVPKCKCDFGEYTCDVPSLAVTLKDTILGHLWLEYGHNKYFLLCRKKHQASSQMYGLSPNPTFQLFFAFTQHVKLEYTTKPQGSHDPWRSQVAEGIDTHLEHVTKPQVGGLGPGKYTPFLISQNRCHLLRVVPTLPSQELQKVQSMYLLSAELQRNQASLPFQ